VLQYTFFSGSKIKTAEGEKATRRGWKSVMMKDWNHDLMIIRRS
jgi:hypothetical protein